MGDRAEHMEHEFAGGRRGIEAFLEADEVDAAGLEVGDDFEEFAQGASESVEADHAQPVAGSGVVDELGKTGAVRALSGGDVGEDTDGAGLEQTVALSVRVLLAGGYAGIAQRVAVTRCVPCAVAVAQRRASSRHGRFASVPSAASVSASSVRSMRSSAMPRAASGSSSASSKSSVGTCTPDPSTAPRSRQSVSTRSASVAAPGGEEGGRGRGAASRGHAERVGVESGEHEHRVVLRLGEGVRPLFHDRAPGA